MKPMYSRALVDLSLELHIPPKNLYEQLFKLRHRDTPIIKTDLGDLRREHKKAQQRHKETAFDEGVWAT